MNVFCKIYRNFILIHMHKKPGQWLQAVQEAAPVWDLPASKASASDLAFISAFREQSVWFAL